MRRACGLAAAWLAVASCIVAAQNVAPRAEYARVAADLKMEIGHEMADKRLPSLAIALVDDQQVVYAEGFGFEDGAHMRAATAQTVFRIGSVSKLFTDIAVMQLVERGKLDLDAPVTRYLPTFRPHNPFGGEITLRELMSHRAGLVREPPVGHYFDNTSPSIDATVASLNETSLVYAPGTHTKYSNAGIAVVGDVIEHVTGRPFAEYLREAVLGPLAMQESAFAPDAAVTKHLAQARMWSYDGLDFAAPTFELGEAPAGAMYSTVTDLARFMSALFAGGQGASGEVLKTATLESMWKPQYAGGRFGLGFVLGSLSGQREVGHDGAIYGFATSLAALPDVRLGVVVVTTVDSANAVTGHIAQDALRMMLARRNGGAAKPAVEHEAVGRDFALAAEGTYAGEADASREVRLDEQEGKLVLGQRSGGFLEELKRVQGQGGDYLAADSRLVRNDAPIRLETGGTGAEKRGEKLTMDGTRYKRIQVEIPAPARGSWGDLIGEYGWDYDKLYVLEDRGRLKILVEWFEFDALDEDSRDHFRLPKSGLYDGETLTFLRDAQGQVTGLRLGYVVFRHRKTNKPGEIFQITPLKPVAELRREALAEKPPVEMGEFRKPELVELTSLDTTIKLDIRYATTRNFLGAPLYLQPRAFMERPAAEAVARASTYLHTLGYGLLIHDSYRPWYVTKMFWDGTPDDKKIFVADPSQGSRHNRGCAVDLTLYDLKTGAPIEMTGGYDEMSERSYPFYPGGTARQRWTRDLLRHAMEAQGFTVYEYEWWHFDYKDWKKYPILNLTFEQLDKRGR
jgi:CubicO group peptidase (beta-lactamase class C family)/D-alanyl-D-alanine dipeptidase